MDLSGLNKLADGSYLPTMKISELEIDRHYMVTSLKSVMTRFGEKVVATLDEEIQIFLPSRVCEALNKNADLYENLCNQANKLQLFLDYKGKNAIEFSTV